MSSAATTAEAGLTYEVAGRRVRLPLTVGRCRCGLAAFTADAGALTERLPAGLVPFAWRPGRGVVMLSLVDYRDNPLGDYDELVVATAVRRDRPGPGRPGRGALSRLRSLLSGPDGVFVHHMPVDQAFTREAGETIWGYPKTHDRLRIVTTAGRAGARWWQDGRLVLELGVPRGGRLPVPPGRGATFSLKDGRLHRTRLTARGRGARLGPGGASLTLGDHPVADGLRALKLSAGAVATAWAERVRMRFGPAVPTGPGTPAPTRHAIP